MQTANRGDGTGDIEVDDARAFMRRLAGDDGTAVIERAVAATEDLETAVTFVERVGLAELERAVETTTDPALQSRGERALQTFERFRAAAAGELDPEQFHRGHDTDLRRRDEATTE